jgi:hypothetical protein
MRVVKVLRNEYQIMKLSKLLKADFIIILREYIKGGSKIKKLSCGFVLIPIITKNL